MSFSETIQKNANYWVSMEIEGHELQKNQIFLEWLRQDERHQIAFEEEKKLIRDIYALPEDFLVALRSDVRHSIEKKEANRKLIKTISPYVAACILLMIYIGFFMERITFSQEYPAHAKVQKEILLPDTSTVSLDAGTSMHVVFSKAFYSKRLVHLSKGKAMFSVAHDSENPFIVLTEHVVIEVVGTKFEVLNYDDEIRVNVLEGKVVVSSTLHDKMPTTFVQKAQSLVLNEDASIKAFESVETDMIGQWEKGRYLFTQEPLSKVFAEFAKHLDISVVFKSTKVAALLISGNFDVERFEDFLNTLPIIHPVKVERYGNQIVVR